MTTVPKKLAEVTNINLTQASQGLKKLNVTINWAFNPYGGKPMDVDFCCFVLGKDGQTREDEDFVFYNNPQGAALAVKHMGDAAPDSDSGPSLSTETIMVDLDNLSFDIWRIVFVLSIYEGVENDQTFDVLRQAVFTIQNAANNQELARLTFSGHKLENATAIKVAEIARDGVEWHYTALKEPVKEGLAAIARSYGILISSTT
ncbi:MAG: TerD family protein [Alphaproteobacteria bacterium]|nr:TerD family protein [Alphaproteobacteria bacterium]